MEKEYKVIPGFAGYEIAKDGTCRNVINGHIINPHFNSKSGYPQYCLTTYGKRKMPLVHRLVALTYIDNPDNKPQVHHIDGNRKNFNVTNLQWVTPSENISEPIRTARYKRARQKRVVGVDPHNGWWHSYPSATEAARQLNKRPASIWDAIKNKNESGSKKTICGYEWYYESEYFTKLHFNKRGARS